MSDNFLFIGRWYDSLMSIKDIELRTALLWRLVDYGATGKYEPTDSDTANVLLADWCAYVDETKENYESRVSGGKNSGRKPSFDREKLKQLIAEGKKGKDIAQELGVHTAAIYHDPVWTDRARNNFYR